MRIAILSPFYPYRGGIAQFSAMLYTNLLAEGCEVQAFNFKRLYPGLLFPGKTQYVEEGDEAIRIDGRRVLDSIDPFSYFRTVKEMKTWKPDVLIISYWMSFFVPGYAHVANRMKKYCKVITLIHNAIPHEPRFFDKPMAGLFFRQSAGFIIMSENVKNDLQQLKPGAKYMLSPHPLYDHFGQKVPRHEACGKLGIPAGKKNLLFFGLIRDYKGLDLLIDAFSRLDDSYQLIIAGECYGSFDKYQQQIDTLPDPSRVVIHNRYIQDNEMPLFFSASDVLVLPYRSATQSGVISVAYHFEVPMVGTPVGDFRQAIADTGTGIVVPELSADSLLQGINDFFGRDRALFLENIRKEKAALSWETFTKKLLSFIETEL